MIEIELLFFAQIRDALGAGRETLAIERGATVEDVVARLRARDSWRAGRGRCR